MICPRPRFSLLAFKTCACCLLASVALGACAVRKTTPPQDTTSRVGEAVTAPLADLNLMRTKIPDILIEARKAPYHPPGECDCDALGKEIQALDEALGADLDAPSEQEDASLIERGGSEVGDAAIGAIRSAAVGWIPYRGWVRKLTGAERHSKEVAAAVSAGIVRRAYLKGLGEARGCAPPAAPLPPKPPAEPESEAKPAEPQ